MAGTFELKKTKAGFSFNLLASNKKVILSSEVYETKRAAQNGIASVQKNAGNESRFEIRQSKKGQPYFVLLASNQVVIGKSQMYSARKGCRGGVQSVKRHASGAKVIDLTDSSK